MLNLFPSLASWQHGLTYQRGTVRGVTSSTVYSAQRISLRSHWGQDLVHQLPVEYEKILSL